MSKNIVVVESPAKAKTLEKYLGKGFKVLSSYGHVRDLEPKEGAVDPDHDFAMRYQVIERNQKHVAAIIKALKNADALYLASDPDREGEAIAWHLHQLLQEQKVLKGKPVYRIAFNEITKSAVTYAVENPREISMNLVNAQQARRALDYLVGFTLSPLLWRKIRRGLSAGRVQSPALRMIVEREIEIEEFKPQEYWSIVANLSVDEQAFAGRLSQFDNKKVEQFSFTNEKQAGDVVSKLNAAANGKLRVAKIEKKQRKRHPAPPFITSTLQQEAVRKLGFSASRAMRVAQQLYEGVDVGEGSVGLITYMRTDSVNLAQEALTQIRGYIAKNYDKKSLPAAPRVFKTKSKNTQEAHEAIRPTDINRHPDKIKKYLNQDQLKVYRLIWRRALACQMIHATIDTVAVDLACGDDHLFRANGSTITHPGFLAVYQEGFDDSKGSDLDEKLLPPMKEGDIIDLHEINSSQHFTEPPPRFSEASLIKTLEEYGIGRPSTYTSIISTLLQREYVILESKRFKPTDVGRVVARFLTKYFGRYVDYEFTANLEDELDAVSRGEKEWVPLLKDFWSPFKTKIDDIAEHVERKDVVQEAIDEKCPTCGEQLSLRLGKRGRFIGCNAYPECDYTRNVGDEASVEPEVVEGRQCPDCNSDLLFRVGRYGKFIGCSNYPKCKFIEPLVKPVDTNVQCPKCKKGSMMQRKSRRGKIFYSCSKYPTCDYAVWNQPLEDACPSCQWPMLTMKTTKSRGDEKVCPQKGCGFVEPA